MIRNRLLFLLRRCEHNDNAILKLHDLLTILTFILISFTSKIIKKRLSTSIYNLENNLEDSKDNSKLSSLLEKLSP